MCNSLLKKVTTREVLKKDCRIRKSACVKEKTPMRGKLVARRSIISFCKLLNVFRKTSARRLEVTSKGEKTLHYFLSLEEKILNKDFKHERITRVS